MLKLLCIFAITYNQRLFSTSVNWNLRKQSQLPITVSKSMYLWQHTTNINELKTFPWLGIVNSCPLAHCKYTSTVIYCCSIGTLFVTNSNSILHFHLSWYAIRLILSCIFTFRNFVPVEGMCTCESWCPHDDEYQDVTPFSMKGIYPKISHLFIIITRPNLSTINCWKSFMDSQNAKLQYNQIILNTFNMASTFTIK